MEDAQLLNHYCRAESEDAFSELVRRYLPLVYSAALRRLSGDTHAAEDVAQSVFSELARQAAHLANRTSLEGWLYTTTRNLAVQRIRADRRRAARERESIMTTEGHESSERDADRLRPFIDSVLDQLRESDREVILLRFYRGRPFADIAQRFAISEDAARFRLNRALERLKRLLRKSGISSSPAALTLVFADHANAASAAGLAKAVTQGALTKAAATGHASLSLTPVFQLMSNTKAIAVVAALVACAGGLLLHREHAKRDEIRAELASQKVTDQTVIQQLVETRSRRSTANEPSPTLANSTLAASRPDSVGLSPALTGKVSTPASSVETKAVNWELSRDPEIRAALAAWMGSVYRSSFAAFYRSAHLSVEQITALEALALENDINMGSAVLTLRPENKTLADVAADRRKLLGDAVDQEYQRYRQTQFVRDLAIGLAGILHDTEAPLSLQQAEQLTQIFAESSPIDKTKSPPFPKDIDWSIALPRARGVLKESQFTALTDVAAVAPYIVGGLNPARPGMFGEGTNPPPALYLVGGASK